MNSKRLWVRTATCVALPFTMGALYAVRAPVRPLSRTPVFVPHHGQGSTELQFSSHTNGYSIYLTRTGATLETQRGAVQMTFVHGAPKSVEGAGPLPSRTNYFLGNDPAQWRTGLPNYSRVLYRSLYPGVDLLFYGGEEGLEYDLVLEPGADPGRIRLALERSQRVRLLPGGDLAIAAEGAEFILRKPKVYQEVNGVRKPVEGRYRVEGRSVVFQLGAYDRGRRLVIDPVLAYSTFFGGSSTDFGRAVAVDAHGNVYVAGYTGSADLPVTPGAYGTVFRGGTIDGFLAKYDASGALIYTTYLGGSGFDTIAGLAVDGLGNAYVTGSTQSVDFPVTSGAYSTSSCGGSDAFVTALNAQGNALLYSTYLGGTSLDQGTAIAVNANGEAFVAGTTDSADFPVTPHSYRTSYSGGYDVFVTHLNAAGTALVYSTYLGGSNFDEALGLALDGAGNAYVTGGTISTDFPVTVGAAQSSNSGLYDAFVTALDASGRGALYSTYLGGSGLDISAAIAADASGNVYITGYSFSPDYPVTPGAFQGKLAGLANAMVTKLSFSGAIVYSTFLGGSGQDVGRAIAVSPAGVVTIAGETFSTDFPVSANAFQSTSPSGDAALVATLSANGGALVYGSYLGGSSHQSAAGVALDVAGNLYITGDTQSPDFPVAHAAQPSLGGLTDTFVVKFSVQNPPPQLSLLTPDTALKNAGPTFLAATGSGFAPGASVQWTTPLGTQVVLPANFISTAQVQATAPASLFTTAGVAQVAILNPDNSLSGTRPFLIADSTQPAPALTSISPDTVAPNSPGFALTANGAGFKSGASVWWTGPGGAASTLPASFISAAQVQAAVPASLLTTPGIAQVAILNPGDTLSNTQPLLITANSPSPPVLNSISPSSAIVGSSAFTLTAAGGSYQPGASIWWTAPTGGSVALPATFTSSAQLQATVPASLLTTAGTAQVAILNPDFGLSGGKPFQIYNAGPQVVSVTPSSGAGVSQTFSLVFSDPLGAGDLQSAQMIINPAVSGNSSCYVWVDPVHRGVYLTNDTYNAWPGAALGSSGTLQNSQCAVNAGASSVALSGNTLTVNLALTFLPGYAGVKNIFGYATTAGGLNSGWQKLGSWTVPSGPQAISVTPASGSGISQTFSVVFLDPNGAADLTSAQVIVNPAVSGASSCYVWVDPVNKGIYMANDSYNAWPGTALGSPGTLQNSQCTVNAGASSVIFSGNMLTVNLALTFQASYVGAKNVFGYATTAGGQNSGWQKLGSWTVPSGPQAVSVAPVSGSGISQTFSVVFSDPNGAADLTSAQVIVNPAVSGLSSCYVWVDPVHKGVYLTNDTYNAWPGTALGSPGTLQNSQCKVDAGASNVSLSGDTLTVNVAISFEPGYAGAKNVFAYATTSGGQSTGWQKLGTWTVPAGPQAVSVAPSSGSGATATFSVVFADSSGAADLNSAQVIINPSVAGLSSCYVWVDPAHNSIYLTSDAYNSWPGTALGSSGTLHNSQCTVNAGMSSVVLSGDLLTVNLSLTFQPAYAGAMNVFGYATTVGGQNTGWQKLGTWTPH
jgi:hypothetical protein